MRERRAKRRNEEPPAESDPRAVALDVLCEVEKRDAFADAVLSTHLDASALDGPDRALATMLVYGTLARRLTIDHTIEAYNERDASRLETTVHELVRLGVYQLCFLDRVPSHAAVNTSVDLAKDRVPRAAGFVNAILRRVSRDGPAPPPTDPVERLAIEHSHPEWLVRLWVDELGETETTRLMHADNGALETVLRALVPRDEAVDKLAEQGIGATPFALAPDAIAAPRPVRVAGVALPQNAASQAVVRFLAPAPGDRVLDACAAPGGKTAYIASLAGETGRVTAVDSGSKAVRRIRRLIDFAGVADRVDVVASSVQDYAGQNGGARFDRILVDAPCSGLGTLSEHPEIRWRRTPDDLADLAARQKDILAAAAPLLAPGGTLVYSTCTIARCENDDVVDAFLAAHGDFEEDRSPVDPPVDALVGEDGRLRTFPHRHGVPGFFAARLARKA